MKQRLEQFLAAENMTQAQFADAINMARAGISHIMAGRNMPSYEFITNTMEAFPELNIEWLLKGTGKMYKTRTEPARENAAQGSLFPSQPSASAGPSVSAEGSAVETRDNAPVEAQTSIDAIQNLINQGLKLSSNQTKRKVVRIMLFYDDNTYEEFC